MSCVRLWLRSASAYQGTAAFDLDSSVPSPADMAVSVEKPTEEVLSLPTDARALLADRLVESLDPIREEGISKIWTAEALRRRDEVRSGQVNSIPEAVVAARVRNLLKK